MRFQEKASFPDAKIFALPAIRGHFRPLSPSPEHPGPGAGRLQSYCQKDDLTNIDAQDVQDWNCPLLRESYPDSAGFR